MQFSVRKTEEFDRWFRKLKDRSAKVRILSRVAKIENEGHFGDNKTIEGDLKELRFFQSPGYRVYFVERSGQLIILLGGGDKSSQKRDIDKAKQLMSHL